MFEMDYPSTAPDEGGKPIQMRGEGATLYAPGEDAEYQRASYVANLFMPNLIQQMQLLIDLSLIFLGWVSITIEVFIREEFGERYLNPLRFAIGLGVFGLFLAMGLAFGSAAVIGLDAAVPEVVQPMVTALGARIAPGEPPPPISGRGVPRAWYGTIDIAFFLCIILYAGLYHLHRGRIEQRNREGILWHSMSFGVSRLIRWGDAPGSDWQLYRFSEPVLVLVAGAGLVLLTIVDATLAATGASNRIAGQLNLFTTGFWLMFAALALLIRNTISYYQLRDRMLNIMDARIEAANLQPSLQGQSKRETAGFSVMPLPAVQQREAASQTVAPDIAARVAAVTGDRRKTNDNGEAGETKKEAA